MFYQVVLSVVFVGHVVQRAVFVHHGPLVFANPRSQLFVFFCFGIPREDVGVVLSFVTFSCGKPITFCRFNKIIRSRYRVFHQRRNGVEVMREQPFGCSTRYGYGVYTHVVVSVGFKVDVL